MDLTVRFKNISDETLYDQLGNPQKVRRYDFFLGTHGPFTERVPLEGFSEAEITNRVQRLKTHMMGLPQ